MIKIELDSDKNYGSMDISLARMQELLNRETAKLPYMPKTKTRIVSMEDFLENPQKLLDRAREHRCLLEIEGCFIVTPIFDGENRT